MHNTQHDLAPAQVAFLDALRGLGAQLVLVGHALAFAGYKQLFVIQNLGVIIFFILSGFLIGYTVTRNKETLPDYDIRHFVIDRVSRIFVPYLPALVFVLAVDSLVRWGGGQYRFAGSSRPWDFFGSMFQLQDQPLLTIIARGSGIEGLAVNLFGSGRPYWTVGLEWWIYVTFSILAFGLLKAKWRSVIFLAALALIASEPLFHAVAGVTGGISLVWFLACLLGIAYRRQGFEPIAAIFGMEADRRLPRGLLLLSLVLCSALCGVRVLAVLPSSPQFNFYDLGFDVWLMLVLLFVFLLLADVKIVAPAWIVSLVTWSAAISYSLYLTHYTLLEAAKSFGFAERGDATQIVAYFVFCNLVGAGFYWLFERHHASARRWLKRRLLVPRDEVSKISRVGSSG